MTLENRENGPQILAFSRFALEAGSWSLQVGIALMLLGACALLNLALSRVGAAEWSAWIIVLAGLVEGLHAFRVRLTDAFFLHLVPGVAGVPIGLLIATHSTAGAFTWMLLFAAVFTIVGLFRIFSGVRLRFPGWPWAIFDGVITLLLGSVLWAGWTWLGTWFFAFAAGVSLLTRGWAWVMFARRLRSPDTLDRLGESEREEEASSSRASMESQEALRNRPSFSFAPKLHNHSYRR